MKDCDDCEEGLRKMHMGRLVQILSHQMRRPDKECSKKGEDGLTMMQRHVLNHILLETLHREVYQKDIEEEFEIRKSTVTGILQLMEKNGYIRRESVDKDARLKKIVPTQKAEAMRPDVVEHVIYKEKILLDGIPEEDIFTCKKALWRMFLNMAKYNGDFKEADRKNE